MRLKASSQTPAGLTRLLTDGDTKEALRLAQEHKVMLTSFLRVANLGHIFTESSWVMDTS